MTTRQSTYDGRDTNVLKYSGIWFLDGTWSDASGGSGTLASTNDQNGYVSFTFPTPAISFTYYGMMRSRGGQYAICIDCDPASGSAAFSSVNGFDASDNGKSAPVALFSRTFSQAGVHVITMRNEADSRGTPAGNSQLTLDRIVLQIPVPGTTTTTTQQIFVTPPAKISTTSDSSSISAQISSSNASTTSATSTSTSSGTTAPLPGTSTSSGSIPSVGISSVSYEKSALTGIASSTTSANAILAGFTPGSGVDDQSDTSSSSNIGSIIGAVLGSLAAIVCIILVVFWLRRRRPRATATALRPKSPSPRPPASPPANHVEPFVNPLPSAVEDPAPAPISETEKSSVQLDTTTTAQTPATRTSLEKRRSHYVAQTQYSQSSSSSLYNSASSSPGREPDAGRFSAGPLSTYVEEDVPPPYSS